MTPYERAGKILERLQALGVFRKGAELGDVRYVITEEITDALIEQVDHARVQAPRIEVRIEGGGGGDGGGGDPVGRGQRGP